MRNDIINIRANFAAAAARVRVVAVDVIRNGFASCMRLYCHSWQMLDQAGCKHGTPPTTAKLRTGMSVPMPGGLLSLSLPMPRRMRSRLAGSLGLLPRS